MSEHIFPYKWTLKDANFTKDKGKVFSTFSCGGGSTMGYKLAGFDVIGNCDIDLEMITAYRLNHKPKVSFHRSVKGLHKSAFLTKEMFELDILDGSPPCSSFSISGLREKTWGTKKVFREGQKKQNLDTLFFDFIDLANHLRPKVCVAENVPGILMGNAKQYVRRIYKEFDEAGYIVQHWQLDSSVMGVPQKRERVFFIALRKDLCAPFMYNIDMFTQAPKLDLVFNETPITFGEVRGEKGFDHSDLERGKLILHAIKSDKSINDINQRLYGKLSGFNSRIRHDENVCGTITAGDKDWRFYDKMACSDYDYAVCGTFPLDYNYSNLKTEDKAKYIIGMSVPPVMTAQIAKRIYDQWLSKI